MNLTVVNILIVVATLAIIVAAVIVLILVLRMEGKGRQYKYKLSVANLGNVASRYDLKAEDSSALLQFQFALNGAPLGVRQTKVAAVASAAPARVAARAEPQAAAPAQGGVKKAAGNAMGFAGVIADLLMSVGYILPQAIGRPLVSIASQMRYGEYAANRVGNVQNQVQQFGKIGQTSGGTYVGGSAGPLPASSMAVQPAAPVQTAAVVAVPDAWTQTPVVAPGGTLALDLLITPLKADHAQRCGFSVASRAIEDPSAQVVQESGEIQLTGISLIQRVVPWVVFAVVVLGTLACSTLFIAGYHG